MSGKAFAAVANPSLAKVTYGSLKEGGREGGKEGGWEVREKV